MSTTTKPVYVTTDDCQTTHVQAAKACKGRSTITWSVLGVVVALLSVLIALVLMAVARSDDAGTKAEAINNLYNSHVAAEEVRDANIMASLDEIKYEMRELKTKHFHPDP